MPIVYKIDIATELNIYEHLFACKDIFHPSLDESVNLHDYAKKIRKKAITFEAWDDFCLAGLLAAYMNDFASNIVYITNVSLRSPYNGHGIASELMKACLKKAKQSKFMKIDLKVLIGNIPAINLYKKFGFKACEKEGNYLKMECHLL